MARSAIRQDLEREDMSRKLERIVLVAPYKTVPKSEMTDYNALARGWVPPIGIGLLSSFLKANGYKPEILDCLASPGATLDDIGRFVRVGLGPEKIREYFRKEMPQLVGISCNFTSFYMDALEIAKIAKEVDPGIVVILGGAHATMDYSEMIKEPDIDMIVRGEGEYTLLEYLKDPDRTDILSTVIKKDKRIIENDPRPVIEDLDSLPLPDYDALNMDFYLGRTKRGLVSRFLNQPVGSIVSSRGCPYNCIFCSTCKVFKKFRGRSAKSVVDEIELLVKRYGVREIAFHDDCFIASKDRVADICGQILARRIKVRWSVPPGFNVWLADEELLRLMVKSGLFRANFPIETGSPETLKFIRKPVTLVRAKDIIKKCNDMGIYTTGNFIIGFPFETKKDIDMTADFIYNSGLDAASVLICQPQKGSDLFNIYKEEGLLTGAPERGSTFGTTQYDTKYFKAEELNIMRREILRRFFDMRIRSLFTPAGFWVHVVKKIGTPKRFSYFIGKVLRAMARYDIIGIVTGKASSPFSSESAHNQKEMISKTGKSFGFAWGKFGKDEVEKGWYKDSFSYIELLPGGLFKKGARCLDVGCGSGADLINMIKAKGMDMVGIDINDSVRVARDNMTGLGLTPKILKADVYDLPFREGSFDAAYSFGVLHHLPEPEKAFGQIVRYVKKGSPVVIYVYEKFTNRSRLERFGLSIATNARKITSKMNPRLLYLLCIAASPAILVTFSLPAKLLSLFSITKGIADRMPFRHTINPACLVADLFDRFSPPIENRYDREEIEGWFRRAGMDDINVINYRGWVAWGRKK